MGDANIGDKRLSDSVFIAKGSSSRRLAEIGRGAHIWGAGSLINFWF